MSATWHKFASTSDDDNECEVCGVVVDDQAMRLFALRCPAGPCAEQTDGSSCVFVPGPHAPECAYCTRQGTLHDARDHDDEDDEVTV